MLCCDGNLCGRISIKINEMKGFSREVNLYIVHTDLQQMGVNDRKIAENTFSITYFMKLKLISINQQIFFTKILDFD